MLLYELLTGSTPLIRERVRGAAYAEVLRRIKDEEPPRPSTRLSESGESLASISAQRQMEPAQLTKLMRGELDWIVMKTLEKDRNRRYETANGFAADVQHYLHDEPVEACPPSAGYRMRKFVRRNSAALTVGVLLALSLLVMVAGITAAVGWAVRDRTVRDERAAREFVARQAEVAGHLERILDEVAQLAQAEKWSDALVSARRAQPLLAGDETTTDIRKRVQKNQDELEFVQQLDEIRAEAGTVWGDPAFKHFAVADPKYAKAFREFGIDLDALPLEAAVDRIKSHGSILPPVITAIDDWVAVRNLSHNGSEVRRLVAVINVVDSDPWRQSLRSALASKDWAAVHRLAKSPEFDRQPAAILCVMGAAVLFIGEVPLAIDVLRRAQLAYPGDFWINHRLGISLIVNRSPENANEGIGYLQAAVALRPENSHALLNLGREHHFLKRYDEAEACLRKVVKLNPKSAGAHSALGRTLSVQGKLDEAIACYRKAIELDPKSAEVHNNLAWLLTTGPEDKFRDPRQAVELAGKAVELDPQQGSSWNTLGVARYRVGDWKQSINALTQSNELMKGNMFSFNAFFLAMAHWQLDEKDEAGKWYKQAVEWMDMNQPKNEELARFRAEAAELLGIAESVLPNAEPTVN